MKISIITPSYNQGQFIERTLISVATQSGAEIQHLVMDGGSIDQTVEILKKYSNSISWVSEKDNGQTDAVNKGIRSSDGEIIGWLNSDDIYYPGVIARVVEYFELNPECDVIYGMADHIDIHDHPFESYPSQKWDFDQLKETCFICQPALFFRRRVFEKHGLLDESLNYCMDYEYWLRLGKADVRFDYVEEKFAGSRMYADNKTLGARIKVHSEINDMFKKKFGEVPDRWLFNYAHAVVEEKVVRQTKPKFFMIKLLTTSLFAAFKWNSGVTKHMGHIILQWGVAVFSRGKNV